MWSLQMSGFNWTKRSKPKSIQFTIKRDKEKSQILPFEMLQHDNMQHLLHYFAWNLTETIRLIDDQIVADFSVSANVYITYLHTCT